MSRPDWKTVDGYRGLTYEKAGGMASIAFHLPLAALVTDA